MGPQLVPEKLRSYRTGRPLPAPLTELTADSVAGDAWTETLLAPEGFILLISEESIGVAAATDAGKLYAVLALYQLLLLAGERPLPTGRIEDYPDFPDRGYMLDVSRNRVPTREYLLRLLDLLSLLRFNHLELYLEHTFAYSEHVRVWEGWSPLRAEDFLWLDEEAAGRAIELVPNQNSFGHMAPWLSTPGYEELSEAPEGFTDPWGEHRNYPFSLSPVEPRVLPFLEGLYEELLPNFRSDRCNVGLDETFDLGQGRSARRIEELMEEERSRSPGLPSEVARERARGRVYLEFLLKVHRLLRARGRRMQFWADIVQNHSELIASLPKDALAVEWGYEADHDFETRCRRLSYSAVPFLVAPGTAAWNSPGGRFDTASANIRSALAAAKQFGAAGFLLTDWGDNGHLPPPIISYPAIAVAGELGWTGESVGLSPPELEERAYNWIGRFSLRSPRLVTALRGLNLLDRVVPETVFNASVLGVALLTFDKPIHFGVIEAVSPECVVALDRKIGLLEEELERLGFQKSGRSPELVSDEARTEWLELRYATRLARYGLILLELRRRRAGLDPGLLEEDLEGRVVQELGSLKEELEQTWLSRSRSGGLESSLRQLRRSAVDLGIV